MRGFVQYITNENRFALMLTVVMIMLIGFIKMQEFFPTEKNINNDIFTSNNTEHSVVLLK